MQHEGQTVCPPLKRVDLNSYGLLYSGGELVSGITMFVCFPVIANRNRTLLHALSLSEQYEPLGGIVSSQLSVQRKQLFTIGSH